MYLFKNSSDLLSFVLCVVIKRFIWNAFSFLLFLVCFFFRSVTVKVFFNLKPYRASVYYFWQYYFLMADVLRGLLLPSNGERQWRVGTSRKLKWENTEKNKKNPTRLASDLNGFLAERRLRFFFFTRAFRVIIVMNCFRPISAPTTRYLVVVHAFLGERKRKQQNNTGNKKQKNKTRRINI